MSTPSLSMYAASIPVFVRALTNLKAILAKGAAHAESRKLDASVLTGDRLYPDMFPLTRQVQVACDTAKNSAARLAGVEAPKHADDERTFPELQARLDKVLVYLGGFEPKQIDGSEDRAIKMPSPGGEVSFRGQDYLFYFALPNLFFHAATAYNILRHDGVELGKMDFLGRP
ncbi:MAG TPA: DUF1993 domain-containing protein [Myxococcota bacterium]|nr:DUF1993 domain-containing protein [Myxococcota bacterium]